MRADRRPRRLTAAVVVVALVMTTGCATRNPGVGDRSADAFAVPDVYDFTLDPASAISEVDPTRENVASAEQLRGLLEQALLWHGITLVQVMRAARADDPEVGAWIDQLSQNTLDLTDLVGLVYGPAGARGFNQQWAQHTQFLVDYAVAVGDGDAQAAASARSSLLDYTVDSGSFFETATGAELPAGAVQELLDVHVQHMLDMIEADQAGDPATAVSLTVIDGTHLAKIGAALATAIATQQPTAFPGSATTAAASYCTIVTTQTAAYVASSVMLRDPGDARVVAAAAALAETVGEPVDSFLGVDERSLGGSAADTAAAARSALDRAAAKSAPTTGVPAQP